jgi:drug/metabolite transporter (DMT)-like permease
MDTQPRDGPSRRRVIATFCLGALGIAFAPIFVRLALPAPPLVTGFYRMLFALPVLAVWVALQPARQPASPRALAWALGAGLLFGTDLALWHLALLETSVANATLLVNTTPIPVGLWAAFVLRERPDRRFVLGTALALLGTALLLGADLRTGAGLAGGALALSASLFYAGYLILMKRVRRHVDARPALLAATVGAAVVIGALALARGDPFRGFPAHAWLAFGGVALVSHVGGVLGIAWGLRFLRATFASVALLVQPLGATLLGAWLLSEALAPLQTLAAAAVLAGIVVASRHALDTASEEAGARAPLGALRPPARRGR